MFNFFIAALLTFLPFPISTNDTANPPLKPPMKTEEMKQETPPPVIKTPHALEVEEDSYESMFMRTMLILFSLLVFVALCVWLFKRMAQNRAGQMNYHKTIKVLETRAISPKTLLYLIEVGDRRILLSESQLHVKQLTTLDFPEEQDPS